jgi:hypothetical protein
MRIERVVLEHHGDVALGRVEVVDDALADGDRPLGDRLEPGDHAQKRGLAAAGRADEHEEFAVVDVDRHRVDGALGAGIDLGNLVDMQPGHLCCSYLSLSVRPLMNQL